MATSVMIAHIAAGGILLLVGRRLFWLFVMIAGFLFGATLANDLLIEYPRWVIWITGALFGLIGAMLAIFLQRLGFVIAGFYGGSYLAILLAQSFGSPISDTAVSIAGGFLGALFAAMALDWAIIVLSSLAGAGIIVAALELQPSMNLLAGAGLAVLGVIAQAAHLRQPPDKPVPETSEK